MLRNAKNKITQSWIILDNMLATTMTQNISVVSNVHCAVSNKPFFPKKICPRTIAICLVDPITSPWELLNSQIFSECLWTTSGILCIAIRPATSETRHWHMKLYAMSVIYLLSFYVPFALVSRSGRNGTNHWAH